MKLAAAFRLLRAGWVLARAGALSFVDIDLLSGPARLAVRLGRWVGPRRIGIAARGERLSAALNRLGPSYIKLGQFLATRPDVVGMELADALMQLKDGMPDFGMKAARERLEADLGVPVEAVFASFSPPVAAASIAQVHRATVVRSAGVEENVAVKILRPGVRKRFARDLESFYLAARVIERRVPATRRLKPVAVVDVLQRSVTLEMDLRIEAAALSEMSEVTADDSEFHAPDVDWLLTGRNVLVTDWVDGMKLSQPVEAIKAAGHDTARLAAVVVRSFLRQALQNGFFHADMHEGNLFVDKDGRLVAVDFGIMGRIGPKERRFLAEILLGFINRDYQRVAEVHFEAGYVPSTHSVRDFAQALRSIGEPIHGQRASSISMAKLLGLLFEITDLFDMQTRPELIMLQKTMVVVEGVARRLNPDFDMWTVAEPTVRAWVMENLGPAAQVGRGIENMKSLAELAADLPRMARRAEHLVEQLERVVHDGVALDSRDVERLTDAVERRNRLSIVLVFGLVLLLVILVVTR